MKFDRLIAHAKLIVPLIDERSKSLHVSYLLKKKQIVSIGVNRPFQTHPVSAKLGVRYNCIHGELDAVLKSRYKVDNLGKLTLVNLRFRRDGTIGNSKPCTFCQRMLDNFGITDIYYSNTGGGFVRMV